MSPGLHLAAVVVGVLIVLYADLTYGCNGGRRPPGRKPPRPPSKVCPENVFIRPQFGPYVGGDVLKCRAHARPSPPNYTWTDSAGVVVSRNATLKLPAAGGPFYYTCTASATDCTSASESINGTADNPCTLCQTWYDSDRQNTSWLEQVNREFPCPCNTTRRGWRHAPTDPQSRRSWRPDARCIHNGWPYCSTYNPGADGCLISARTTSTGARQQCCYDSAGTLLGPDHRGAGTPDRASGWDHHRVDVEPHEWCCQRCQETGACDKYHELRRGSNAHCG